MVTCEVFFFFKQKTAYDLRISDWSSDVCSSDLLGGEEAVLAHGCSLLIKGGHAEGETVIDRLLETGEGEVARWEAPRIDTKHSHGTGCTLASAIASRLAQGMPLEPAIARARDFVRLSLPDAPGRGQGHGPMGKQVVGHDGRFIGPSRSEERRVGKECWH